MNRLFRLPLAACLLLLGCSPSDEGRTLAAGSLSPPRALAFTAMGTVGELLLPGEGRTLDAEGRTLAEGGQTPPLDEGRTLAAVRDTVSHLESQFSIYQSNSVPSRLADGESVPLSEASLRLFRLVDEVVSASGGAYDPTVGPLMRVWGFRGGDRLLAEPPPERLVEGLSLVGWSRVVEVRDGVARLAVPGARLDFGGVAKGFAVDEAFDRLRSPEVGRADFLVNLGGNMRASGKPRPGADGWSIAVRDPFKPYGEGSVGTLTLADGMAVATSGCYEQFVEIDGVRHTHILDPRTGRPVRGMAQVTVVAPGAALADALSTACFVLGPEESVPLLAAFPGTSAYFIPDEEHGGLSSATAIGAPFPWRTRP